MDINKDETGNFKQPETYICDPIIQSPDSAASEYTMPSIKYDFPPTIGVRSDFPDSRNRQLKMINDKLDYLIELHIKDRDEPKEPVQIGTSPYCCPNCGSLFILEMSCLSNFCPKCGQAIKQVEVKK